MANVHLRTLRGKVQILDGGRLRITHRGAVREVDVEHVVSLRKSAGGRCRLDLADGARVYVRATVGAVRTLLRFTRIGGPVPRLDRSGGDA